MISAIDDFDIAGLTAMFQSRNRVSYDFCEQQRYSCFGYWNVSIS